MSTTENMSKDLWREHSVSSLVTAAHLYSRLTTAGVSGVAQRNERTVQALLLLLDSSVAVAGAVDDNILEDLQALPVDVQEAIKGKLGKIQEKLNKIAEKTTQPHQRIPMSSIDPANLSLHRAILKERTKTRESFSCEDLLQDLLEKVEDLEAVTVALLQGKDATVPEPAPDLKTKLTILIAQQCQTVGAGQSYEPIACAVLELVADWLEEGNPGKGWLYADKLRDEASK